MAVTIETRAGDTQATLELQLIQDGALVPLVGNEVCQFIATDWQGNDVVTLPGSVSDVEESWVSATAAAQDTVGKSGQVFRLRTVVAFSGGRTETFPVEPDDALWVIT